MVSYLDPIYIEDGHIPRPAFSVAPIDAAWNTITSVKYARNTFRGLTNFMKNTPRNRPTAKQPCAPARKFAPAALDVPLRTSTT